MTGTRGQEDKRTREQEGKRTRGDGIKQDNEDKLEKPDKEQGKNYSASHPWTEGSEPPCSESQRHVWSKWVVFQRHSSAAEATRVQECSKVTRSSSLPPYMFFRLAASST